MDIESEIEEVEMVEEMEEEVLISDAIPNIQLICMEIDTFCIGH